MLTFDRQVLVLELLSILLAALQLNLAFPCVYLSKTRHSRFKILPIMDYRARSSVFLCQKNNKAPIYVTIGPQCAGKTSFLKLLINSTESAVGENHQHEEPVHDISIDDEIGVYLSIPKKLFLVDSSVDTASYDHILFTRFHNKTISERIYDDSNKEQRIVLQRLCNVLSADEFSNRILSFEIDARVNQNWRKLSHNDGLQDYRHVIIELVEKAVEQHGFLGIDNVDLFVVESIFRSRDQENPSLYSEQSNCANTICPASITARSLSGLSAATEKLKYLSFHKNGTVPLAWGNTNTKSSDYLPALEAAERSGRPVYFIPYMSSNENLIQYMDGLVLPNVGIVTLLERNIQRLIASGRYIPSKAIIDASVRVNQMIERVIDDLKNTKPSSKSFSQLEFDMALTNLSGDFIMSPYDRTVRRINRPKGYRANSNNHHNKGRNMDYRHKRQKY